MTEKSVPEMQHELKQLDHDVRVLRAHGYGYEAAARKLMANSIRARLAALGVKA